MKVQGQQEQQLLCGITWGWRVWPGAEENEKGKDAKTQEQLLGCGFLGSWAVPWGFLGCPCWARSGSRMRDGETPEGDGMGPNSPNPSQRQEHLRPVDVEHPRLFLCVPPSSMSSSHHSWEISHPRNSLECCVWGRGSLHVERKTLPSELQQLHTGITDGTVKGVNATQHKNYVENKGSYSCFKTFSQLELTAFNQLLFFPSFFLFFIAGSPFCQTFAEGKETKVKREKNSFSCQSVACKAMKNTLRETSMYYRKGKGVHASSLLKSFQVPSLLRPPVSPSQKRRRFQPTPDSSLKSCPSHPLSPGSLLCMEALLSHGAVLRSSALMPHPGLLPGLAKSWL